MNITIEMKKVVVLLSLVLVIMGQYRALDCFRIEHATVWSGSSIEMMNQVGGYDVTIPWTKLAVGIEDYVMSLTEFKMSYNSCVFMSYQVSLTYTTTHGVINLNPHNSKIFSLTFTIALITTACSANFEAIRIKHPMSYLNQLPALRTNGIEQYINLTLTKFNFANGSNLIVAPFLTAINVSQSCLLSLGSYHLEYDYASGFSNQTNFSLVVRTWRTGFRIDHLSLSILVFYKKTLVPNAIFYTKYASINSTNHSFVLNYGVPDQYYNLGIQDKCITRTWRFLSGLNRPYPSLQYTRVGKNVTEIRVLNGIDYVLLQTYCFIQCDETYYNNAAYSCIQYIKYVPNCIAYTTTKKCTACRTDYALVSPTFCSLCNGTGRIVQGGCTTMVGCIAVQRLNFSSIYPTRCILCDSPQFYLDAAGICRCNYGQVVTQLCIQCYGCISTQRKAGKTICISCDVTANFTLAEDLCQCKVGFRQTQFGTCVPECGDGLLFYTQECDDGNQEAYDGCLGCKIEPFFKCQNGSETTPSRCRFIGKISIVYQWAEKIENENRGILSFKVSPSLPLFTKMDLNKFFTFASPANHSAPLWTYTDSRFQMEVDFQTDLEETVGNFTFSFDPTLFIHKNSSQAFEIRSRGVKLRIVKGLKTAKMLSQTIIGITTVAILVVTVGSAARRMIGVEALQVYQIIFFAHLATEEYTQFYSKARMFGSISGNPYFFLNHFSSFLFQEPLNNIPFDPANTRYAIFFLGSFLLLCSLIASSLALAAFCHPLKTSFQKAKRFFFEHVLFPIAAGSWLPATLLVCTLSLNIYQNGLAGDRLLTICLYLLCMAVSLIIFYQWKHMFVKNQNLYPQEHHGMHQHPRYIPMFLSYSFIQLALILCTTIKLEVYLQESLGSCALAMLLWQLKVSPYKLIIHNAGILFNQLTIALFCLWSILRDKIPLMRQEEYQILLSFLLVAFLTVCLILAIARTIISIKQDCSSDKFQNVSMESEQKMKKVATKNLKNKLEDFLIQGNAYSLFRQRKEELLGIYREQNENRIAFRNTQVYNPKYVNDKFKKIRIKNSNDKTLNSKGAIPLGLINQQNI